MYRIVTKIHEGFPAGCVDQIIQIQNQCLCHLFPSGGCRIDRSIFSARDHAKRKVKTCPEIPKD